MSKAIKISLIIVGAVLTLFIAAAVALVILVDPNEYKDEIAQAVKENTGRELIFEGDIGFNFFPWLGLDVGPMALGNAPGFAPTEMVRINKAEASIQIMPLLSGNIAIGNVVLDGLTLNLTKNAKGVTNWDDLAKSEETTQEKPAEVETEKSTDTSTGSPLETLSIEGVKITNANVLYDDQQAGKKTSLGNLNLLVGEVGNATRFPFELSFDLKLDDPKIDTRPVLEGVAKFDQDAGTFEIEEMKFTALNLKLTGLFFAKAKDGATAFSGELKLAEASVKKLMKEISIEPPVTADPAALEKLSMDMKFNGTDTGVDLENMTIKLDDTTISINGSVTNFDKPAIKVIANIDDIDADRYMPPASESTDGGKTESSAQTQETAPAQEPDLSALKGQNVYAKLTIGKLKAMNLRINEILCELTLRNGVATIKPFAAKLYDGELVGHSTLNANTAVATWKEAATLKGVQAGPLLKDLVGKDHLHGATVVKYDVVGRGLTPDNIKKSITGTASFAFTDGAIMGVNIAKMLRDGWNTLKGKSATTDEPAKTDFAELLGSATLTNGHIVNKDLLMKSPLLRVTGKGWANLPKNSTDYTATVTVVGTLKGQDGASMEDLKGLPLPINVKGDLNDPKISLDTKALAEALFKGKLGQGTKDLEKNLKQKLLGGSTSTDSTTDKPTNPLGGLFKKK
ncbi:AsmA family protein [Pseudodesulfovibrio sediminis]|uniref:Cell envelope biogenesis protein AsmA n=1 Tax=Pseudodesulfovibrio sediminis TaxID=2810563 RepID=A0ABM8HX99_9BACT|nr:AsmA family protein [Pseudodesulfovibrio sediminis]BCS89415.1 cell envelope biogenesis protein AsmA [Pseudodesulfovibrio sediminis]